jgi:DNA-directed RNA polymerase beta' subunit
MRTAEAGSDRINDATAVRIRLAGPDDIRGWSSGEVTSPATIQERGQRPEPNGLFCERIFGPVHDWSCACTNDRGEPRYWGPQHRGKVCDRCGVQISDSLVRRRRLGHIELAAPVVHTWFLRSKPSPLATLLGVPLRNLVQVLAFERYAVIDPGRTPLKEHQLLNEERYSKARQRYGTAFEAESGARAIQAMLRRLDLKGLARRLRAELAALPARAPQGEPAAATQDRATPLTRSGLARLGALLNISPRALTRVLSFEDLVVIDPGATPLHARHVLSRPKHDLAREAHGDGFEAATGVGALLRLVDCLDADRLADRLRGQWRAVARAKLERLSALAGIDPDGLKRVLAGQDCVVLDPGATALGLGQLLEEGQARALGPDPADGLEIGRGPAAVRRLIGRQNLRQVRRLAAFLGMTAHGVDKVLAYRAYVVTDPRATLFWRGQLLTKEQYDRAREEPGSAPVADLGPRAVEALLARVNVRDLFGYTPKEVLTFSVTKLNRLDVLLGLPPDSLRHVRDRRTYVVFTLEGSSPPRLLTPEQYREAADRAAATGEPFRAITGWKAVRELLDRLDRNVLFEELHQELTALRGRGPAGLAETLEVKPGRLERALSFQGYLVTDRGSTPLTEGRFLTSEQLARARGKYGDAFGAETGPGAAYRLLRQLDQGRLARTATLLGMKPAGLDKLLAYEAYAVLDPGPTGLRPGQLLTRDQLGRERARHGDAFTGATGAEAVEALFAGLRLEGLIREIRDGLTALATQERRTRQRDLVRRLKVVEALRDSGNRPEWMVLECLPVIPPDLRPVRPIPRSDSAFRPGRGTPRAASLWVSSDLNYFYQQIVKISNQIRKWEEGHAVEVILRHARQMLQRAVDALFDNARCPTPMRGASDRPLRSLTDMIQGKQGRFRQNLLGKRVDYSARGVIVSGPALKLHQCGLPRPIAEALFQPLLVGQLADLLRLSLGIAWPAALAAARMLVRGRDAAARRALREPLRASAALGAARKLAARLVLEGASRAAWEALPDLLPDLPAGLEAVLRPLLEKRDAGRVARELFRPLVRDRLGDLLHRLFLVPRGRGLEVAGLMIAGKDREARRVLEPLLPDQPGARARALQMFREKNDLVGDILHGAMRAERDRPEALDRVLRVLERKDELILDVLEQLMRRHPVLLNRAPTLHRMNVQAFQPVLVPGKAIRVHPLVCEGFGADFDGDTMAVHLPLSVEARVEAALLMTPAVNLLSPANGRPVQPSNEMVLGCAYLTAARPGAREPGEGMVFASPAEILLAHATNKVGVHAAVTVRLPADRAVVPDGRREEGLVGPAGRRVSTTVGRVLFNELLPPGMPFYDLALSRRGLAEVVAECFRRCGRAETAALLDRIKDLGFREATRSGFSFILEDLKEPGNKREVVGRMAQEVDRLRSRCGRQLLEIAARRSRAASPEEVRQLDAEYDRADRECYERTVGLWKQAQEEITRRLKEDLKADTRDGRPYLNPLYLMAHSGARGKWVQLRQLAALRGLMDRPAGPRRTVERPITSSLREGLSIPEYFVSTHGARKAGQDKARLPDSGYLTRKLADVVQHVVVTMHDCGTSRGLTRAICHSGGETPSTICDSIEGRCSLADVTAAGETVVRHNDVITREQARRVEELRIPRLILRSPMTCEALHGVCRLCYGTDLSTGALVEKGTAVGILAAQSIGEPGTQLAMKTKHYGGVAGGPEMASGLDQVTALFDARRPDDPAVLAEVGGVVRPARADGEPIIVLQPQDAEGRPAGPGHPHAVPPGREVLVGPGDRVEAGAPLTAGTPAVHDLLRVGGADAAQTHLLQELQGVYRASGIRIESRHFEVILAQMFRKVRVEATGDTGLLPGAVIDRQTFQAVNQRLRDRVKIEDAGDSKLLAGTIIDHQTYETKRAALTAEGKRPPEAGAPNPATCTPVLLGITQAAMQADSFLSAASFQQTSRVLAEAALAGRVDPLAGLKENVMLGRLVPVGTGFPANRDARVGLNVPPARRRKPTRRGTRATARTPAARPRKAPAHKKK